MDSENFIFAVSRKRGRVEEEQRGSRGKDTRTEHRRGNYNNWGEYKRGSGYKKHQMTYNPQYDRNKSFKQGETSRKRLFENSKGKSYKYGSRPYGGNSHHDRSGQHTRERSLEGRRTGSGNQDSGSEDGYHRKSRDNEAERNPPLERNLSGRRGEDEYRSKEASAVICEKEETISLLNNEIKTLKKSAAKEQTLKILKGTQAKVKRLEEENNVLKIEKSQLSEKLKDLEADSDDTENARILKNKCEELQESLSQEKGKSSKYELEINRLKKNLENNPDSSKLNDLELVIKQKEKELKGLEQDAKKDKEKYAELKRDVERYRNERDDAKKKKDIADKVNSNLRKDLADYDKRVKELKEERDDLKRASMKTSSPRKPSTGSSDGNNDLDDSTTCISQQKEARVAELELAAEEPNKEGDVNAMEDGKDDLNMDSCNSDESFTHPPDSVFVHGNSEVRNFHLRRNSFIIPMIPKDSTDGTVITSLNNSICFAAIGPKARTKHNEKFGKKPCSLYPYCDSIFKGGEEIGKIKIFEPKTHPSFGVESWACWHHAKANLEGVQAQNQRKMIRTRNSMETKDNDEKAAKRMASRSEDDPDYTKDADKGVADSAENGKEPNASKKSGEKKKPAQAKK